MLIAARDIHCAYVYFLGLLVPRFACCTLFSPGGLGGRDILGLDCQNSHCRREFDRRLWHRGGTIDGSARKSRRNCLYLKACPGDFGHKTVTWVVN